MDLCIRGGKALNRSVGSLFIGKGRKAKYMLQVLLIGKVWWWNLASRWEENVWGFSYGCFNFLSEIRKSSGESEEVSVCVEIFERDEIIICD